MRYVTGALLIAYCLALSACAPQNPPPPPPPAPAPVVTTAPPLFSPGAGPVISENVVGLYSRTVNEDSLAGGNGAFGLYTYVLLGNGTHDQNKTLLLAILPSTANAESLRSQNPTSLNLIGVPIKTTANLKADRSLLRNAA